MQCFYFCIYFFCLPSTAFILCTCACVAASAVCSSVAQGNLVNCHLTLSSWSHGAAFLGGFLDPCSSSLFLPGVGMPFATRVSENMFVSCSAVRRRQRSQLWGGRRRGAALCCWVCRSPAPRVTWAAARRSLDTTWGPIRWWCTSVTSCSVPYEQNYCTCQWLSSSCVSLLSALQS